LEKEMKLEAEKTILCAAKLIAPVIEETLTAGFAWYKFRIKILLNYYLIDNTSIYRFVQ